jgi:hypothetical protein
MRRVVNAAREHEVIGLQSRDLDPLLHGVTGRWRDLELDGTLPVDVLDVVGPADRNALRIDRLLRNG